MSGMVSADGVTRTKKRMRFSGDVVTIKVGADKFTVHETLVKQSSRFFEAALKKGWKEGVEKIVELPHDRVDVVAVYVDWCYSGEVATQSESQTHQELGEEFCALARLWVFGEKIQDDTFCNAVMSGLANICDEEVNGVYCSPGGQAIRIIYEGTPSHSPARRFVVDRWTTNGMAKWFTKEERRDLALVPDFLLDLAVAQYGDRVIKTSEMKKISPQRQKWFK